MLVDSHCHLDQIDLNEFAGDVGNIIAQAQAQGVSHFLCVCIDMDNVQAVLDIASRYDFVDASIGVHPNEQTQNPSVETLLALAEHPKVVAIGETGLDYFRTTDDLALQQERFINHITVAKQLNKPLIIHTRAAQEDTIRIMTEQKADTVSGVMHCFTEDWAMAEQALDLGFYISFSGIITFKNADMLRDVAARVPMDRLLIETDSPYLAPVPMRGKQNQPAYIRYVAEFLAELRGLSLEDLAKATADNYFRLFRK
jgi:TatD DNase family protein